MLLALTIVMWLLTLQLRIGRCARLRNTRLFGVKAGSKSPKVEVEPIVIDAKKQQLLDKLQLNGVNIDGGMTGAELRKERKVKEKKNNKIKKNNEKKLSNNTNKKGVNETPVRFKLGNGVQALTASSLLDLVKSTTPFYFPNLATKEVLDDDYYDDDDDDDDDDKDSEAISAEITNDSATHDGGTSNGAKDYDLTPLTAGANGWLNVLLEPTLLSLLPRCDAPTVQQRINYFALCLASHFSTVASYVPTDVDSKIRGHCWNDPSDIVLLKQFEILKNALQDWDVDKVSKRTLKISEIDKKRPLSGHDGEFLGVLAGALGAFLRLGKLELASEAESLIVDELEREAAAFRYLRTIPRPTLLTDTTLLKLSAIMCHNVGDLDQGLSYWEGEELDENGQSKGKFREYVHKFSKLSHERSDRYGGEFILAKSVYKELLSSEGHRHYPLREAKCLRSIPDLMLPLGPWFEQWGRLIAMHPRLSYEDKLIVIKQLLRGCDSTSRGWCVPNQVGYYRALNGINSVHNLDRIAKDLDKDCANVLKSHEVRMHLGLSEKIFAEKLAMKARDILR